MTIAERLSERHSIEFMGKRWPVLFTHDLLLALEEQTGLSVLNGDVNLFAPSAKVLCATIFLILQRAGAKCTLRSVGALLKPGRATAVVDTLAKAWRASMPKAELESERAALIAKTTKDLEDKNKIATLTPPQSRNALHAAPVKDGEFNPVTERTDSKGNKVKVTKSFDEAFGEAMHDEDVLKSAMQTASFGGSVQ